VSLDVLDGATEYGFVLPTTIDSNKSDYNHDKNLVFGQYYSALGGFSGAVVVRRSRHGGAGVREIYDLDLWS
jgi:hypothetical protein